MKLIDILVEELPKRGGWPKSANCITQDGDLKVEPAYCHPSVAKCRDDGFWFLDSSRIGGFEVDTLASDYTTAIITREQYEAALSAKDDGWIEWGGGECPVNHGVIIDAKDRDGYIHYGVVVGESCYIEDIFWHRGVCVLEDNEIIAYRLHKPTKSEQVRAAAWNSYAGITMADDESDLNECIWQGAAPVWSGEGLPPVGMEIEYSFAKVNYRTDFSRGKVLAYGMHNVFMERWASKNEFIQPLDKIEFRPIRSEAERKREKAVQALCNAGGGSGRVDEKAGYGSCWFDVYDAIAAGKIPGVKLEY